MMGEVRDESGQSGNDGSGKAPYKINQSKFAYRLGALYSHWQKHKDKLWGSSDFLAISTPPNDIRYLKTSTLILWLLGCEFPETIIVFGRKCIYILCSQTKASLLETVKGSAKMAVYVDVVIHAKPKDEDGTAEMSAVLHSMCVSKSEVHDTPIVVGYIVEESPKGSISEKWAGMLINSAFQLSDVTNGLSDLFCLANLYDVKDPNEVRFRTKAAYLTTSAMKYFVIPKLKRAIDMDREFTHSSLMDDTQKAILYPRIKVNLNADNVDVCHPPNFESGGKFDRRCIAISNDDYLIYESPTSIICAIGSRYNNGCYVARTFLVDANAFQSTTYEVLLRAYEAAINAVKPGNRVRDVYLAALEVVRRDDPELVSNLTATVGTCFGLALLHVPGWPTNVMSNVVIKAGLRYNISLGFHNLLSETGNLKSQTFSLLLGDTVVVRNDRPEVITRLCSKDVKEVTYSNDTEEEVEPEMKIVYSGNSALYSKIRPQSNKHEISKEELLRHFQAELAQQRNETPKQLAQDDSATVYNWASLKTSNELLGSQRGNLCINVARRILIDANAILRKAYSSLGRAHKAATNAVKPGNKVLDVYNAAILDVKKSAPELVPNLTRTAGTCIGLEFSKSGLSLDLDNDQDIKVGMVFNIVLGFQNLLIEAGNPKSQLFSLLLEDVVVVTNSGCDVITELNSRDVKDVAYSFCDGYEEVELRVKVLYLQEILKTARQFAGRGSAASDNWGSLNASNALIAYNSVNDLPPPSETMIQVDQKNEAVLLPIYGVLVPFHITTVKRVYSLQVTNNNFYIRIIFNLRGTPFTTPCEDANSLKTKSHHVIYLKGASFLSKDPRHVSEVVQQIKSLRRCVLDRESKRAERPVLAAPEKLQLAVNKCKPIRLSHLLIRPPFGGLATRETIGALEAFANCFRYSTSRPDEGVVDILYANIKHAFFQPTEKENDKITLLHLHLHDHVMVGNKKTRDVQFYIEVAAQRLEGGENRQQKRERDKINMDFQNFVNDLKVQSQFKQLNLEFELPLRKLGFHGVVVRPYNNNNKAAFIVPTSSCLVELIETPFLVITLSEIEIVSLERIGVEGDVGQKDFDMAIVFKDFKRRDVIHIDSIPSTSFDGVIDWLENVGGIRYYVNGWNRNWHAILKAFTDDPQLFIELGGWDFLKQEADSDSAVEPSPDSDTDSSMSDYDQ